MTFPSGMLIARGLMGGCSAYHVYGRNTAIGSSPTPVTRSGYYRTPQANAPVHLRIRAGGNANDTANGTGGRAVTFIGIGVDGSLITETVATAGTSASAATTQHFVRLRDAIVSASGSYATQTAGSHASTINIEDTDGNLWGTIADGTLGRGNMEQAVFVTPKDRAALITNIFVSSDADKKANIVFYKREGILKTAAPYDAMQLINEFPQSSGLFDLAFNPPLYFPPLTDFGFLASVSASTVDVSVGFDVIEVIPT
jgi:hypothetical protein